MTHGLVLPADIRFMNAAAVGIVGLLAVVLLGMGLGWVLRHPAFAIRQIVVGGDTVHNSASDLRRAVVPKMTGNFFTLDLGAAQAAFQSAPWVRQAQLQRVFPGQLHVRLEEHVAVAHWGDGDTQLVNSHGEVFDVADTEGRDDDLPILEGPIGQAAQVLAMQKHLNPLVAPMRTQIAVLKLKERGDWRAELENGAVLELGRGSPEVLAVRLGQFVGTVQEVAARHQRGLGDVEAADLRHPGGYALRLRQVSTVSEGAAGR